MDNADITVTREINAPAERVWELISDMPRMGEWSPETEGGEWIKGATGPVPGAKFRGANRHQERTWKTVATVIDAEPGRRFSFRINALGMGFADWAYDIEPTENGCKVTESWSDLRPGFFKPISKRISGVSDRQVHNQANIENTLEALAAAAEADSSTS